MGSGASSIEGKSHEELKMAMSQMPADQIDKISGAALSARKLCNETTQATDAAPTQPVFITWKKWETTVQIGSEKLEDGFRSFEDGPRVFYTFAEEQPGTQKFDVGDVSFYAYAEEKPGTVKHTICSAFMKWWVGPLGVECDKGGREESGDGWELTSTFWAPQSVTVAAAKPSPPNQPVFITWKEWETTVQIGSEKLEDGFGSFEDGPRVFYTFAEEQPGTQKFDVGDVSFYAYAEEKPGTVKHTICSAFMKWWVGPVGVECDKGGREESGDGWELTSTFWAPQSACNGSIIMHATNEGEYLCGTLFDDGNNRRTVSNWMNGGDPLEDSQAKWMIKELEDGIVTISLKEGDCAGNYLYAQNFDPEDGRRLVAAYMTGAAEDDEQAKWFKRQLDDGSFVLVSKHYEGNYLYASAFDDGEGRRKIYCWAGGGDPAEDPCAKWKIMAIA